MPSRSAVRLTSFSIDTGFFTGVTARSVIFKWPITFSTPRTSTSTSLRSTGPDRPASAVNDGLPRVVAVFSRKRDALDLRPIGRNDDRRQSERQHHRARRLVLFLIPGDRPVAIGREVLVEVAAMEVDHVIGLLDDFLGDDVQRSFGLRALRIARIEPVHVLVVCGVKVRSNPLERRHVHKRHEITVPDTSAALIWLINVSTATMDAYSDPCEPATTARTGPLLAP